MGKTLKEFFMGSRKNSALKLQNVLALYTITQDYRYSHFGKLPNLPIKVNDLDDFNKSALSFIESTAHIT